MAGSFLALFAVLAAAMVCLGAGVAAARPTPASAVISLPSSSRCVGKSSVSVGLKSVPGFHLVAASVKVNGKKAVVPRSVHTGGSFGVATPSKGGFTIEVVVVGRHGVRVHEAKRYEACASHKSTKPTKPTAPTTPKPPTTPTKPTEPTTPTKPTAPTPPEEPAPKGPETAQPGHYSGSNPQSLSGGEVDLYVSPSGSIQDVSILSTKLGCAPTKTLFDHLEIEDVEVESDGAFAAITHQTGVIEGVPAEFTYTVSGDLKENTASGSFREDISFNNGTSYSCTTNNQSWTATRDESQSALALPAQPGHYSGTNPQGLSGGEVDFYVAPSGNLQDVSILSTKLGCAPSRTAIFDHFEIGEVAVGADGSFSAATSQSGVVETATSTFAPATFTYTFSGHVHGAGSSGRPRVAGVFREDIAFENGTSFSCSTNSQSFTSTRDETQSALGLPAQPGHYSGTNPQSLSGGEVDFYVAPSGNLQDVSILSTRLGCAPSRTPLFDHFEIDEVAVGADGSFSATGQQTGIIESAPATFTYTFSGHVHGGGPGGRPRIAGSFREDVSFDNGTSYSCTTDNQSWTSTRDETQSPVALPAQAGTYRGTNPQGLSGGEVDFSVAADGDLQNVVIAATKLACSPSRTAIFDHLELAEVQVAADGSFSVTEHQAGVIEGAAATFTYTFRGHVHGGGTNGAPRLAGVFREDISFNNGTAYSCTTDNQSWTSTRSGT